MASLGTAQGVPVTLVRVDEARATPIWLDGAVPTRPYMPRPSGRASRVLDGPEAYSEAVLHEALACIRAHHAAQPDWWTCQARALRRWPHERGACELAACVEAAERAPGSSRWAHVVHTNDGASEKRIVWERDTYVLPPRSAFLLTDLLPRGHRVPHGWADVRALLSAHGGASLVVVDPPWPNKSAERAQGHSGHGYGTVQDVYDMWRLRPALETLLGPDTLLAVWVTNAPRVQRFVTDKLMPALGVVHQATWAWLKVTAPTNAPPDTVLPLDRDARHFRRPYELVLVGARTPQPVAPRHILASVPLGHSAKPYLGGALGRGARRCT
ncbi:hypothetical protein MCAP1_000100 [Malassezia caprae]|uniref:Methyltransferase-like protein 4 n=1 Tax=Malassezia caprae TaxID=1381934 RepID=A0AAF0E492_9BASI|nr:hypothetical protein MCAP1_000100 [Malassezia caprae]